MIDVVAVLFALHGLFVVAATLLVFWHYGGWQTKLASHISHMIRSYLGLTIAVEAALAIEEVSEQVWWNLLIGVSFADGALGLMRLLWVLRRWA